MSQGNNFFGGGFPFQAVQPTATPTTSTSLPANLASLLNVGGATAGGNPSAPQINMQALNGQPSGTVATNPNYPVLDFRMQPTYADGGQVGPMGMPMIPGQAGVSGAPAGTPVSGEELMGEADRISNANPQVVQQIQQAIMQAVQSGQLTMEQLSTAIELAKAAAQNPQLYPRLRTLAIQRGLATEEDLPQYYDQGVVLALLLAAKAVEAQTGARPQRPMQQLANGGQVQTFNDYLRPGSTAKDGGYAPMTASPTGDNTGRADDIPIRVSGGEYVIPKHVVDAKGTEFFDKLLDQYYSVVGTGSTGSSGSANTVTLGITNKTTSGFRVTFVQVNVALYDPVEASIIVMGG